jgi:hypothetical protein
LWNDHGRWSKAGCFITVTPGVRVFTENYLSSPPQVLSTGGVELELKLKPLMWLLHWTCAVHGAVPWTGLSVLYSMPVMQCSTTKYSFKAQHSPGHGAVYRPGAARRTRRVNQRALALAQAVPEPKRFRSCLVHVTAGDSESGWCQNFPEMGFQLVGVSRLCWGS